MGAVLNDFMKKFNEFKDLPSGKTFTIMVTDTEASAAAQEYLAENKPQVKQLIQKSAGMSLDVDNPEIRFGDDEISMSVKGGKGFLKVSASLDAEIRWDGRANVVVRSVNVPFVSISPEKLNFVLEKPLEQVMGKVEEYAEIRSFTLCSGSAVLEAVKK